MARVNISPLLLTIVMGIPGLILAVLTPISLAAVDRDEFAGDIRRPDQEKRRLGHILRGSPALE